MEPEGSLPHSQVPSTCPYPEQSISPGPKLSIWTFRNKIYFYVEDLLATRPIPKLEDHDLWSVRDCLVYLQLPSILDKVVKYNRVFFCRLEWYPKNYKNICYVAVFKNHLWRQISYK